MDFPVIAERAGAQAPRTATSPAQTVEAQTIGVLTDPVPSEVKDSSQPVEEQPHRASTSSARTDSEGLGQGEAEAESVPTSRRVHVPFRRTLYIQEQGSVLARDDERLVVKKEREIFLEVPAAKIDQIFVFGNCTITTPAMTYCLKEDIPIILFSSRGNYYGIIDSPLGDNVSLHRQQFARVADPAFCLATAKAIIETKLHNSRLLLQRHQRRKQIPAVATAIDRLGEISMRLPQATTLEEANGYEGAGAAQYFAALGQLVDPTFQFSRRTRVQESVFECHLTGTQREELQELLEALIESAEDNVRSYRVCQDCVAQSRVVGPVPLTTDPDYYLV